MQGFCVTEVDAGAVQGEAMTQQPLVSPIGQEVKFIGMSKFLFPLQDLPPPPLRATAAACPKRSADTPGGRPSPSWRPP